MKLPAALLMVASACAQTVDIYSEWSRPDPFGGVVAADRGWKRREVLSPAVGRNGWASFHIVVSVPPKESYLLYVIPNPVSACRVALYREHFTKTKDGWIPDRLTEVHRLPDFGTMPDPDDGIDGQTTRAYLLDLWLPPNADVARFRLEVQMKVADWEIRPMELRVVPARFPDLRDGTGALPEIEQGSDAAAGMVLSDWLAGRALTKAPEMRTVRDVLRRNAAQDLGLASDPGALMRRALELFRANSGYPVRPLGGEWWLRVRDWLFTSGAP